jgi:hypothetical protein
MLMALLGQANSLLCILCIVLFMIMTVSDHTHSRAELFESAIIREERTHTDEHNKEWKPVHSTFQ